MAQIVLHPGFPKTGTSAIQRYFSAPQELGQLRLMSAGRQGIGNHRLAAAVMGANKPDWVAPIPIHEAEARVRKEIREERGPLLLSSEALTLRGFVNRGGVEWLSQLLGVEDVVVAVVVRNHVGFMESGFLQQARTGAFLGSFDEYIQQYLRFPSVYRCAIERYIANFTETNVRVISYDRIRRSLLSEFLNGCGFKSQAAQVAFANDVPHVNVSVSWRAALLLQRFAEISGIRLLGREWNQRAGELSVALPDPPNASLMSKELHVQVTQRFSTEERWLEDQFGCDITRNESGMVEPSAEGTLSQLLERDWADRADEMYSWLGRST